MTRAPLTLSREMKIGLIALLMAALLGGWLLVNNRRAATTEVAPPPVVTPAPGTVTPSGDSTGTATGTAATDAVSGTSSVQVPAAPGTAGAAQGDLVTAPPFPVTDPNGSTPDPTVPTPLPSGINPNTPLLSLNGHNPFRPVKLDEPSGAAVVAGSIAGSAPEPSTPNVTITPPSSSAAQINSALNTPSIGAIPVAPVPGTMASIPSSSSGSTRPSTSGNLSTGSNSGGVIPVSPLPGTPGTVPTTGLNTPGKTVTIPSSAKPGAGNQPGKTTPTTSGNSTSGNNTSGSNSGNAAGAATPEPTPIIPPVAGVSEPSVSIPTEAGTTAGNAGTQAGNGSGVGGTGTGGAGTGGTGSAGSTPTTPKAITETQTPPVAATPTPSTSELEQYVKANTLVFDAAVLGPVNTAILRSEKGFIVATVGQPLPDSKVTVKEVTATTVTLALGSDTTTLQLDKR